MQSANKMLTLHRVTIESMITLMRTAALDCMHPRPMLNAVGEQDVNSSSCYNRIHDHAHAHSSAWLRAPTPTLTPASAFDCPQSRPRECPALDCMQPRPPSCPYSLLTAFNHANIHTHTHARVWLRATTPTLLPMPALDCVQPPRVFHISDM